MTTTTRALHALENYVPPPYASKLPNPPLKRFALGLLPTPIHPWKGVGVGGGSTSSTDVAAVSSLIDLYIKRDDLSGCELSGNKVRKLEFLVADALDKGADALVSVGGVQSNHARAVACAASAAGLDCHLVLRTRLKGDVALDPGFEGNLLIERLLGAQIHLVSKEEYASAGDGGFPLLVELGERLVREKTRKKKRGIVGDDKDENNTAAVIERPYLIPLGGSNALGAWGYLEASREIIEQAPVALERQQQRHFDVVVLATGSAGTAAGLALGFHLAGSPTRVRAYCVCDDPSYFYDEIQRHLDELCCGGGGGGGGGREENAASAPRARDIVTVVQAKGAGYAISRPDELAFLRSVAASSGVLLDPVYTGKAAKGFFDEVAAEGAASSVSEEGRRLDGERGEDDIASEDFSWMGKKVLFLHTGGIFGLYGAAGEVTSSLVGEGVEAFRKA